VTHRTISFKQGGEGEPFIREGASSHWGREPKRVGRDGRRSARPSWCLGKGGGGTRPQTEKTSERAVGLLRGPSPVALAHPGQRDVFHKEGSQTLLRDFHDLSSAFARPTAGGKGKPIHENIKNRQVSLGSARGKLNINVLPSRWYLAVQGNFDPSERPNLFIRPIKKEHRIGVGDKP